MKYIDVEKFREQMYHRCFEEDNDTHMQKWESGNWIRYKLFEEELEKAEAKAVEIIRCQDCRFWEEEVFATLSGEEYARAMFCKYDGTLGGQGKKDADDFCSRAERRTP